MSHQADTLDGKWKDQTAGKALEASSFGYGKGQKADLRVLGELGGFRLITESPETSPGDGCPEGCDGGLWQALHNRRKVD